MIRRAFRSLANNWLILRDPVAYARKMGVTVGEDCRLICLTPQTFGSEPYLITIGNHVTIAAGVRFLTHDGGVWIFRSEEPEIDVFGPVKIEDNVFVGTNALLMPGITIGANSVIAAGAVITKDVPPDSVMAGVPARRIKSAADYLAKVRSNAFYIRSLPANARQEQLREHFSKSATAELRDF